MIKNGIEYRAILIGHTYKHFKGNLYKVLGLEKNASKFFIKYKDLANDKIWDREAMEFVSPVPRNTPNPSDQTDRFTFVYADMDGKIDVIFVPLHDTSAKSFIEVVDMSEE